MIVLENKVLPSSNGIYVFFVYIWMYTCATEFQPMT